MVGCFALFVFLVSRDCCLALPRGATKFSAVCGISLNSVILIYYFAIISLKAVNVITFDTVKEQICDIHLYTTLTNFSTIYLVMCKVHTDVGGIK